MPDMLSSVLYVPQIVYTFVPFGGLRPDQMLERYHMFT